VTGTWRNTNASGRVPMLVIDDVHRVTSDFGTAQAQVYSDSFDDAQVVAFSARFQGADVDVRVQANVKGGVLVVAYFTKFLDDSGRAPVFHREFYWREVAS
jgi:hypothetical protein